MKKNQRQTRPKRKSAEIIVHLNMEPVVHRYHAQVADLARVPFSTVINVTLAAHLIAMRWEHAPKSWDAALKK